MEVPFNSVLRFLDACGRYGAAAICTAVQLIAAYFMLSKGNNLFSSQSVALTIAAITISLSLSIYRIFGPSMLNFLR